MAMIDRSATEKAESTSAAKEELDLFRGQLRKQQEQKRKRDESFSGGKPDENWLPRGLSMMNLGSRGETIGLVLMWLPLRILDSIPSHH